MEEKRNIIQKKVYDEEGKLKYVIIPNYKKTEYFMTQTEIEFYKVLIGIVIEIKEKYNIQLQICPQVALNRIITQNNKRESELEKDIFAKSIDFVLYDKEKNEIFCCIELDGKEHKTDPNRIKRDKIVNAMFEDNIKLIRQDVQNSYNKEEIINKIISK